MDVLVAFTLSFVLSFIGSIPPGALNLTVIRYGLEGNQNKALRFSIAAALIEYPYAWLAVAFEKLITSSPWIVDNIHLLAAIVMTVLGIINLLPKKDKSPTEPLPSGGFRKGILLSILNPLAVPYWLGITAYVKAQHWTALSSPLQLHAYLLGVSLGAFALLFLLTILAKKVASNFVSNIWLKRVPGIMLLGLGIYAFVRYLL